MSQEPNGADRRRVLLISPLTFSYHLDICDALRTLCFEPLWWNDKASTSTAYKAALRLLPRLTRRLTEQRFIHRINALELDSIDHVLVIKGEGINKRVVRHLKKCQPRASFGLYLWDSIKNVKGIAEIAPLFDSISSFDPVDAKQKGWHHRPLFARNVALTTSDNPVKDYDWCFIGTIHSDRHRVIARLRRTEGEASRGFVFAYFQSPVILLARKLVDWTLWSAPKGTLSTVPMAATDVAQIVACSRAVLDIEHPQQRGLTMRTIETLLTGRKLLSTNRHLLACDLYDPSRARLIDRAAPQIDKAFLNSATQPIPAEIRARYTCEAWIEELLALQVTARARTAEEKSR